MTLTAGTLGIVAGGVLLAMAQSANTELQARFSQVDSQGQVNGVGLVDGYAEADRIESQYRLGWIVAGAGVVGAAIGTVLVLRSGGGQVSVAPTGHGVLVTTRF